MLRFLIVSLFSTSLLASVHFDWQGHRGARGLYPENTVNGMKEALKYRVTTLEMDVVISKDHQVVVSHEPWMNEQICLDAKGATVKDKQVNLYKINYDEIRKYDCGTLVNETFPQQKKVREYKPLLKEVVEATFSQNKNYNIEIKSSPEDEKEGFQPEYKKFSDEVVSLVSSLLPTNRYSLQSFDWRVLKYIHARHPSINLVALREEAYKPKDVLKELGFTPTVFSPDWKLVTAEDVAYFKKHKVKVIPWTVNTSEGMNKMISMGVDGIMTDYPNLIQEIPESSYFAPDCEVNFNRFEGKCVKIPAHAVPSEQNPGWVCKDGYAQRRNSCLKIALPRHAYFAKDGKTWLCKSGYKRYRYKCLKTR